MHARLQGCLEYDDGASRSRRLVSITVARAQVVTRRESDTVLSCTVFLLGSNALLWRNDLWVTCGHTKCRLRQRPLNHRQPQRGRRSSSTPPSPSSGLRTGTLFFCFTHPPARIGQLAATATSAIKTPQDAVGKPFYLITACFLNLIYDMPCHAPPSHVRVPTYYRVWPPPCSSKASDASHPFHPGLLMPARINLEPHRRPLPMSRRVSHTTPLQHGFIWSSSRSLHDQPLFRRVSRPTLRFGNRAEAIEHDRIVRTYIGLQGPMVVVVERFMRVLAAALLSPSQARS